MAFRPDARYDSSIGFVKVTNGVEAMSSEDSSLIDATTSTAPAATTATQTRSNHVPTPIDGQRAQIFLICLAVLAASSTIASDRPRLTSANAPAPLIRIDLNQATHEELNLLPGIGDKMAVKLIDRRDQMQGFTDWQSIESVPGMGPATVREMQQWCSLGPVSPAGDVVFLASRNH